MGPIWEREISEHLVSFHIQAHYEDFVLNRKKGTRTKKSLWQKNVTVKTKDETKVCTRSICGCHVRVALGTLPPFPL